MARKGNRNRTTRQKAIRNTTKMSSIKAKPTNTVKNTASKKPDDVATGEAATVGFMDRFRATVAKNDADDHDDDDQDPDEPGNFDITNEDDSNDGEQDEDGNDDDEQNDVEEGDADEEDQTYGSGGGDSGYTGFKDSNLGSTPIKAKTSNSQTATVAPKVKVKKTPTTTTKSTKSDKSGDENEKKKDKPKELDKDEVNKELIKLGGMKWEGLNKVKLIEAVCKALNYKDVGDLITDGSNESQVRFAKIVWNEGDKSVRNMLVKTPNSWFMKLARNPDMSDILSEALDIFLKNTRAGGDQGKKADWLEICKKYAAAIEKREQLTPFSPGMTNPELRLIRNFEARENEVHEEHKPNESAVTYPFLLGKLIVETGMMSTSMTLAKAIETIKDILNYFAVHGQQSLVHFARMLSSYDEIEGPLCKADIKPFMENIIKSDEFVTSTSKNDSNKFIGNEKLTLKRIVRLVYICTKHNTVWGLLKRRTTFVSELLKLHASELKVKSPDQHALAMIWYLCIGRQNICSVMVDHHEESASNVMATVLGKPGKQKLTAADHAFPFDQTLEDDFTFA